MERAREIGLDVPPPASKFNPTKNEQIDAARAGWAPDYDLTHEVPEGLTLKGTSIRYDGGGSVQQYWNKTQRQGLNPEQAFKLADPKIISKISTLFDQEQRVVQQWVSERPADVAREILWRQYAEELAADLPRLAPIPPPAALADDLCVEYPVGDHHNGGLSWDKETGADYDIEIAEELLIGATQYLIGMAPRGSHACLEILGDFNHYDSMTAETPRSKNRLDSDSRFPKIAFLSSRMIRIQVDILLEHHSTVRLVFVPGNHDPVSTVWLRIFMAALYENEPRVTVEMSPMDFQYWEFGRCLIGCYHGHDVKMQDLPIIMARDQPEAWGRTEHRYWRTGHIHHAKQRQDLVAGDYCGVQVESFRVLGPPDSWAYNRGYRTIRDMKAIMLHREFGERGRWRVSPEMIAAK